MADLRSDFPCYSSRIPFAAYEIVNPATGPGQTAAPFPWADETAHRCDPLSEEGVAISELSETVVLVLQGSGALWAYQAGAIEGLAERGHAPDWTAGISIGAINTANISGNEPEDRKDSLHAFWDGCSSSAARLGPVGGPRMARVFSKVAAVWGAMTGVPGFFRPRWPKLLFALLDMEESKQPV